MLRIERIEELRDQLDKTRRAGKTIGFVPTMGALHAGHMRLVEVSRARSDITVVSIFVNPKQFGPSEDFNKYPRPIDADLRLLADAGVDVCFNPSVPVMYPAVSTTEVVPGTAASRWEGAIRPGHFAGVLTVVAKLFNIVAPHTAYFGRKDFQQSVLVRAMVKDLNMPITVEVVPTVRDPDGLALSSRNVYLSPEQRSIALAIPRSLSDMQTAWREGERVADALLAKGRSVLKEGGIDAPDYLAIVDPDSLEPVRSAPAGSVALIAARVGSTRLIDNAVFG